MTNTNTTKDAIAVQWDTANVSFCGDILKYYVTLSYDNGTLVDGGSTEQKSYIFDDLIDNTYYIIVALASNAAGNGPATSVVVKTLGPQGVLCTLVCVCVCACVRACVRACVCVICLSCSFISYITLLWSCNIDDNDDDSVAAIVGGVVSTFIITLVVSTLISVIITRMYYKYWYDLKRKPNNGNSESVQHDTFKMDTNPSYATAAMATDTIKMDTNPAYTVAK